jgi:hypothetical protein
MRKLLIILLISTFTQAQESEMIIVTDYTGHEISVPDSLSKATVKEYINAMEDSGVNYEPRLRKIKGIEIIGRDRTFISDEKRGVIRLNKRLNRFPFTKRVIILQELGVNQGMNIKGNAPYIGGNFDITEANEERFRRQKKYRSVIRKLKKLLEK